MPASFNRLKQRVCEAIIAAPNRDWRRMLARKRAHAFIAAAAATAVCLTVSSTAPALLEGANTRPMDDYSDGGSGIAGLRDLLTDGSRQSAGVFAAPSAPRPPLRARRRRVTTVSKRQPLRRWAVPLLQRRQTAESSVLARMTRLNFMSFAGMRIAAGSKLAIDVVPSSVRSHIADDQLLVSTFHDDGSVPRESSGSTPGRKASNPERRSTASISHARKGSPLHIAGCSRCAGAIVHSSPRRAKSFVVALAMDFVRAIRSAGVPRHRGAPRAAS